MTENAEAADLLAQFLASWVAGSAEPRRGVTEAELTTFEERHGVRLPAEFKTYLRRANGMQQGEMDSERLVQFYGVDEIVRVPSEDIGREDRTGYFAFADFMIGSHEYAIALAGPHYGEVAIVDDAGPLRRVAKSFPDFMTKYVHSPEVIWRGEPR
jgi:hypothetical protein